MNNTLFGRQGEDLAVEFLQEEGYDILERNWRFRRTEVDIIARHHEFLVIIEVKTRKGNSYGEPYTAVDFQKQRALIFAAERYIYSHNIELEVRFDIISIILDVDDLPPSPPEGDIAQGEIFDYSASLQVDTNTNEPKQNSRVAIEHIKDAFRSIAR